MSGAPASSNHVDFPTSRLSYLTTKKSRAASISTNRSSHAVSWPPRPMMRSIGGDDESPVVSYSIVIPFAETEGMVDVYYRPTRAVVCAGPGEPDLPPH